MRCKRLLSFALAAAMLFGSAALVPEDEFSSETSITASAEDMLTSGQCGEDVYWDFDDGVLTISGKGNMYDYGWKCSPFFEQFKIKSVVIKKGVTSIGSLTFQWCRCIEKVSIPNSVRSIGDFAFNECLSLTSITIPGSVTRISNMTFKYCTGLKSVTMQKGVKIIDNGAFNDCKSLTRVSIPSSVTSIGLSSFSGCEKLTSIRIPSSVTSIGGGAFYGCSSLKSIIIPSSVTSIGGKAFLNTQWLKNQKKKNPFVAVNGILINADGCSGDVSVPNSIKSIGEGAFYCCAGITSVSIPSSVTSIGSRAFYECTNLKSVTIPSSVKSIGEAAFYNCTSLKSIKIPYGVKSIGETAFYNCTGLTSLTIPGSVTSIGVRAFINCTGLTKVTLQKGVKSIGDYAFAYCNNLASVSVPSSIASIGARAFAGTKWFANKRKENPLVIVNGILIDAYYCTGNVTLPRSLKCIADEAFYYCTDLTGVTIPSGVTSIGNSAFYNCTNLKSVNIPKGVTSIGKEAFFGCNSLKSITIPKSVNTINDGALGYNSWSSTDGYKKMEGFKIKCYKDSAGEKYAKDKGIAFVILRAKEPKAIRFAGSDRAGTAALISNSNKSGMYKTADTVVIATGFDFHDALAAVRLASAYNAPLLLADRDNLSAKTLTEIKRLKAKNVIVVASTNAKDNNGKSAAIKSKVYKQLKGYNVTKLVGSSYYETAKKVAQQLQKKTGKAPNYVFFTTNRNYADALSISPVAAILKASIFYVDPKCRLNANTTYYLNSVKSSVKKVFIIGGTNAVSKDVVAKIKAVLPGKTVQRFAGADRYATCVRINNAFKSTLTGDSVCVAKGYNFPDALAGGVFAAKQKAPLFLADVIGGKAELSKTQSSYLKSKNPSKLYIFGGETAVPTQLVKTVAKACV